MRTKRDETRGAWTEHLRQWRQSGKSRAEYCREQGIKHHQLSYWSRRLAGDVTTRQAFAKAVPSALPAPQGDDSVARLLLPSGLVIEFASTIDPAWLGRVAKEVAQ